MNLDFERNGGVETIKLSQRPSTVALVVTIMGLMLNLQILLVLVTSQLSLVLVGLLILAGASAAWLGAIGLQSILPTTVTMDKDGITIDKLLGAVTVPWLEVQATKLVPSVGMLSDDPHAEPSGRLAVGLFLKGRKTARLHELDADILVFGASDVHLATLDRLIDRIGDFQATVGAGLPDTTRRIRKAAPIAPPTAFRRRNTPA